MGVNMKEDEKITGEYLASSLNAIILYRKIVSIENKMKEYQETIEKTIVDIPEFCKMKEDKFETFINHQINQMIKDNTFDYFYKLSLQ
jgi:hypothetical protein